MTDLKAICLVVTVTVYACPQYTLSEYHLLVLQPHTLQSHLLMMPPKTVHTPALNNMGVFSLYPALCLSWAFLLERKQLLFSVIVGA